MPNKKHRGSVCLACGVPVFWRTFVDSEGRYRVAVEESDHNTIHVCLAKKKDKS